ncbi:MAG: hypothetical protein AAFP20_19175 [Cyanobacteria bacterium J06614_10]
MRGTFRLSEADYQDLTNRADLSEVMAEIDTLCFQLDFYEMGQWWNYTHSRRKLTHPAVTTWMEHYGFCQFSDLPSGAVIAVRNSLRKYLESAQRGLTPTALEDEGIDDD